jgi:pSer/pThr/pTyr-binding forkhead associated (FHA) protein
MAKLVISLNGMSLRDYELDKVRVTIGRTSNNDIVLNEPVVSGEHAAISQEGGVITLVDLDSTNGTYINDRLVVDKKPLKHNDVISVGSHDLLFVDESVQDFAATVVMQPAEEESKVLGPAALKITSGKRAGTVMPIVKERTALGKPGEQIAVIMKVEGAYLLQPVAVGDKPITTKLNGRLLDSNARPLSFGDVIEIADIKLEFIPE